MVRASGYTLKRSRSAIGRPSYISQRTTKRVRRSNLVLGNVGGSRVLPSRTTMARTAGPFTGKKIVDLVYENGLTALGGATTFTNCPIVANGAYDVDATTGSYFGNKQPLYYDSLLTSSGPYQVYKVVSWKTTYTILNGADGPMNCYAIGCVASTADFDSVAEAENYPGVKRLYLGAKGQCKDQGTITVTGNISDLNASFVGDRGWGGAWNALPGYPAYGMLLVSSADGSHTTALVSVAIKHEMYTELQQVDSLVS